MLRVIRRHAPYSIEHAETEKMTDIPFEIRLERGMHDFRIVPRELVSKYNYFMIDAVDFVPRKLDKGR